MSVRRALVVAAGATVAAVLLRQLSRAGALDGAYREWHEITDSVLRGMAEREAELRHALGMDSGAQPDGEAMSPEEARRLVEDPTGARAR